MTRLALLALFLFLFSFVAFTQELDCDITLDMQGLPSSEARDNLVDFISQLKTYMNTQRWTKDGIEGDEKIRCTINIQFQGSPGDNQYAAKAFIGSQRPVFKAGRSTAVTRILDDKWTFQYIRGQSLTHDEYRFDALLSFMDFYAYVILGYDFDSYKSGDGTQFFQKAMDIVNKARSSAGAGNGWDVATRGAYSRAQLIEELLNPKYQDLREASFKYHYRGLDLLYKDPVKGRKVMLTALEKVGKLRDKVNEPSLVMKIFFDTKYQEIAETFSVDTTPGVFEKLIAIDPSHQHDYEVARDRRK
ncbi:MAG TPA: DUF4835 family protein [Bacteroidota bacterium]|nr:DUF4835 family protein [Bacteroidota bacterium]